MTKSKKILCLVLAVLMIAAAVFFVIREKIGDTFEYSGLDYSKYITIGDVKNITMSGDDSDIDKPDDADVLAKIAATMRGYYTADDSDTTIKVVDTEAVIGQFDAVYVNYYGTYLDGNTNTIYFTSGKMMDKTAPTVFYVKSGTDTKLFGDSLEGKNPNPDSYKLLGSEDTDLIEAGDIVYITYTFNRYQYAAGSTTEIDESTKQTNTVVDSSLVTTEFRLDLANVPSYFPAGFADNIIGKKVGALDTMTFDNVEVDEVSYRYEYTVTVTRCIDQFGGYEINYTYPADSTEKDIFGNELKGQDVVFHVVVSYFNDAPTLDQTYAVDEDDEESAQESIITHDDYINFDTKTYYTENVKTEVDWLALEENAGKTSDDYKTYLKEQYTASVLKELTDEFDQSRKEAVAAELWNQVQALVTINDLPAKAVKLTREGIISYFKYIYNNNTFKDASENTVSYRTKYGTFTEFMTACYNDEDVIENVGLDDNKGYNDCVDAGASYGECLDAATEEIVKNKLILYYLYETLGDDVKYEESEFTTKYQYMYLYYQIGWGSLYSADAIREGLMFDKVMDYIYDQTTINWTSEATPD